MKRKMLFVFNPHSGKGQIKNKLMDILDIMVKAGYDVTVHPTQAPQDALRVVMEEGPDYDAICCSGGDGTLDETVSGMMRIGLHIPLGYIPAGSTNDFANSLMIPKDMLKAAKIAASGTPILCDVGQFNEKTFIYVAAFGLFTDVSYQTSQGLKNVWGHAAYVMEAAKRLSNIETYHATVINGDQIIKDEFIYGMVSNSKFVGGIQNIAGRDVELDDGVFEVTLIRAPKNPIELNMIIGWLLNPDGGDECEYIYSFKSGQFSIQFEEAIPWTLDGEFGGAYDKIEIENKQQVIPIRAR